MYVPAHFAANDADGLIRLLARRWAGVLVTVDADGTPFATHMPVLWDAETKIATGHIARANPQWQSGPGRALIVLGGAEAYVSPSWYPSKAEHGKVVPTWNYEAVHLSGAVEWFEGGERLEAMLRALTAFHEAERAEPWHVDDAPRAYIDALKRGIVGVSLHADRIEAKRKLSQNKSAADVAGVERGLSANGDALAQEVAALMRAERASSDEPDGNG
ncbi:MAG: FMN-binding negative transcriptional regulator [Hyphomonadaceae bacterium]|nr:FMN-binding negative transcriptional regulator [Hyphomonadaceae bacterium]